MVFEPKAPCYSVNSVVSILLVQLQKIWWKKKTAGRKPERCFAKAKKLPECAAEQLLVIK